MLEKKWKIFPTKKVIEVKYNKKVFGTSKLLRHINGIQDTNIQIPKFEQTMLTLKRLRLREVNVQVQ